MRNWAYFDSWVKNDKNTTTFTSRTLKFGQKSAFISMFSGSYPKLWPFSQFYVQGTK